jgi:hypothetical protein
MTRLPSPVTYIGLVEKVGHERYEAARAWAWRTAAGTGGRRHSEPWPDDLDSVSHELAELWDDEASPLGTRLDLALRLYAEMPCYGNLMCLKHHYPELDPEATRTLWNAFRAALGNEDARIADPIAYTLWCDYFEDPAIVGRAWVEVTRRDIQPSTLRLQRALEIAGPVPWSAKQMLFDQLIDDVAWHRFIHSALVGSAFDYFGQLDAAAAQSYLARLVLADDSSNLDELRTKLASRC